MFRRTTAIDKILELPYRKKIIQGGTWAGKTYSIIPIEISHAAKTPNTLISFVAESIPAVRAGAAKVFKEIMQETGRWVEDRWIGNPMEYKFANGSIIEFRAYDTVGKAKAAGKRDRLFLNEANHIPFAIADALITRSTYVTLDFNPDNEFWAHTEFVNDSSAGSLILTYLDNEACTPEILFDLDLKMKKAFYDINGDWNDESNIKNAFWANWCRVYIKGEIGNIEGAILNNWAEIDAVPPEARLLGYGLDFGYTNDPSTIIEVYKWNDKRILNQLVYQTGLSNRQLSKFITTKLPVYCDSAEPKSIAELCMFGINAVGAKKGPDSIRHGLALMQDENYLVTRHSTETIIELRKYIWKKDKNTGKNLNIPIDNWNHAIDGIRYHESTVLAPPEQVEVW
jgi:phage terminase large subunit